MIHCVANVYRRTAYLPVASALLGLFLVNMVAGDEPLFRSASVDSITEFYLSPWDGSPARFRDAQVTGVTSQDLQSAKRQRQLQLDSQVGHGDYQPLPLKGYNERRVESFDASFEECAPGRRQFGASVEDGVVRGLGDAPFLLVDPNPAHERVFRDWGLCDKRAKSYTAGAGPGKTEAAVASYRVGLAGLPVSYRFRAEPGKKYLVYLVSTPHIAGYLLETPEKPGDLVFEYQVEGLAPQTLDWVEYTRAKQQPLCVRFDGAHDADGDGYIAVSSGVSADSRIKHTRLSVIYVLPQGTSVPQEEAIFSGAMNSQCVWHIDVGATPEQGPTNQDYDKSDLGFARLKLRYRRRRAAEHDPDVLAPCAADPPPAAGQHGLYGTRVSRCVARRSGASFRGRSSASAAIARCGGCRTGCCETTGSRSSAERPAGNFPIRS